MLEQIFFIALRWLAAGASVFGCGLTVGCFLACIYLLGQKEWKHFGRELGFLLLAVGLVVACQLADWYIVHEHYGYYDQTGKYIGYGFPGLPSLFFLPEPLRRAKRELKMRRARFGNRPAEVAEQSASSRVISLPPRRR